MKKHLRNRLCYIETLSFERVRWLTDSKSCIAGNWTRFRFSIWFLDPVCRSFSISTTSSCRIHSSEDHTPPHEFPQKPRVKLLRSSAGCRYKHPPSQNLLSSILLLIIVSAPNRRLESSSPVVLCSKQKKRDCSHNTLLF